MQIIPTEGNFVTMKIMKDLMSDLGFSEEEIKTCGIETKFQPNGQGQVIWKPEKAEETKDIKIGDVAKVVIKDKLISLDKTNRITIGLLPLYERFVEGEEKETKNKDRKEKA